jgi:anti-anti-sigma factor
MITECGTRKIGDVDIVDISGRLNFGNALAEIESSILKLIDEGSRRMVINVPGLTSIDSAGIGMLMGCSGKMEQKQGKLRIAGARGGVARTFETMRMDRVAALDADVDAACRALADVGG